MNANGPVPGLADDNDPRDYIRLASELRQDVQSGKHQPGKPLPSVTTLSQRYGCSRETCAKSLRLPADEGLIIRYPGLGYLVTPDPG